MSTVSTEQNVPITPLPPPTFTPTATATVGPVTPYEPSLKDWFLLPIKRMVAGFRGVRTKAQQAEQSAAGSFGILKLVLVAVLAGFVGGCGSGFAQKVNFSGWSMPSLGWLWPGNWGWHSPFHPAAPINASGLHVMIVYDNKVALPKDQSTAISSGDVRDFLNANCAKDSDGKTAAFRIWPSDVPATAIANEDPIWKTAFESVSGKPLPYIIVSNPQKGGGYQGPLPPNTDSLLSLLKQYGGP